MTLTMAHFHLGVSVKHLPAHTKPGFRACRHFKKSFRTLKINIKVYQAIKTLSAKTCLRNLNHL